MKKLILILCAAPFVTTAQTVVKRQAFTFSNPFTQQYLGLPIGFNTRPDGTVCFYWSQAQPGTLQDGEKEERKLSKLIGNLFDASQQETVSALPVVNESLYDSALKFIAVNSKLVSSIELNTGGPYFFNGKEIVQDLTHLPAIFQSFPYKPLQYPVSKASLSYSGKGLLGTKDKRYYPVFTGEGFSFTSYASPIYTAKDFEVKKEENMAALDGLAARGSKLIFLQDSKYAQGFFYNTNDPDKYGSLKNYQFITWSSNGSIVQKETVNLPFAYEPEGVVITDENKKSTGIFYLCQRAEDAKKAVSPDENSYYILAFDAGGKLTHSFETKLGTDERKVDIITAFTYKQTTYLLAQDRKRKDEKIMILKLSTNALEKVGEFTTSANGVDKELMYNNWSNVQWKISEKGNLYFVGQGVQKVKVFGTRSEAPLAINFMSISPDFTQIKMQKADFIEPPFNMKPLAIRILDEQDENLLLELSTEKREIAAAILGPNKTSRTATAMSPGYTVYTNKKTHHYDPLSKSLYLLTFLANDNMKGEIVKIKF